jgi:hypothetical protein
MTNQNDKYNIVMPQTTDRVLCMQVDKTISEEGYRDNFLPKLQDMIEKYGEIRLLIYYREFKGWEQAAAKEDMLSSVKFGQKVKKLAMVNPPETEIFRSKISESNLSGETKAFKEKDLEKAIEWVNA